MFSHVRHHDKKGPKFSHLINITCCIFYTSPHKEISCLTGNKSWQWNNFFTHLIHFLYQNLKQFPWVSIHSVSKVQPSNGAASSYRLISKVTSASFTQQNDTASWCGECCISPTMQRLQSVSPHYSVSVPLPSQWPKDCIGVLAAYPSCSMACISLHLATLACGSWPATWIGQTLAGNTGSQ
jgi:hypothetical protein